MAVDAIVEVKGCCPLDCQDSCAWVARVDNGRVVAVRGAKDHPITRGALCAKVNDYEAKTYAPDRVLHPLMRAGAKGTVQFRRASWDEALGLIAERFRDIVETSGPEALLPHSFLGSMGVVQRRSLMRLFYFLGASRPVGSICGQSGNVIAAEGHPSASIPRRCLTPSSCSCGAPTRFRPRITAGTSPPGRADARVHGSCASIRCGPNREGLRRAHCRAARLRLDGGRRDRTAAARGGTG